MFKIISRYKEKVVYLPKGGTYEGTFEVIDTANNIDEALIMLREYGMTYGNKFELNILEE